MPGCRRGITVFRMPLSRVEAKIKLGRNCEPADRECAIEKLEASDSQDSKATARWMRRPTSCGATDAAVAKLK